MSWARVYRIVLHLLPRGLRRKHGVAMGTLSVRSGAAAKKGPAGGTHGSTPAAAAWFDHDRCTAKSPAILVARLQVDSSC